MPLYDFECPHGHRFEHMCTMAERNESIPCEGVVNQLITDDEALAPYEEDKSLPLPDGWARVTLPGRFDPERQKLSLPASEEEEFIVKKVPCMLKAKLIVGTSCNIDHGSTSNRDAAREGRYDPLNPNTRFISKGRREWRRT